MTFFRISSVPDGATVVKQIQIPGGTIEVHPEEVTQVPTRLLQQQQQPQPQVHHQSSSEQTRRKRGRPGGVLAAPSFKKIEHDIGLHQGRELHLVRMKIARYDGDVSPKNRNMLFQAFVPMPTLDNPDVAVMVCQSLLCAVLVLVYCIAPNIYYSIQQKQYTYNRQETGR